MSRLLGSGALVGLGALLAVCGQKANNEAAATASAAPSESASASEPPSASATPSTVRCYSGGSKAPDGEYRPTDSKGPPRMTPSLRHRNRDIETSRFSAWKTIRAWVLNENYSIQTGDYTETFKEVASRSICGSSCKNIKIRTQKLGRGLTLQDLSPSTYKALTT